MSNFDEKFWFQTILPGKDCDIFGENNDKKNYRVRKWNKIIEKRMESEIKSYLDN